MKQGIARLGPGDYECGLVQLPLMTPGQTYDVRAMGAVGDGRPHPLSERYATLEQARADFPAAQSLDQQIDGEALRKAVATAMAAGGGTVFLPPGNYYVDRGASPYQRSALDIDAASNLTLEGAGPDRTTLTLASVGNLVQANDSTHLAVRNLRFDGSRFRLGFPDEQYHGLVLDNTRNVLVENVDFFQIRGDGVRTISNDEQTWAENVTVRDSAFVGNGRAGASHQRGSRRLCYTRNVFDGQENGPDLAFEATGRNRRQASDIWITGNLMQRDGGLSINAQGGENVVAYGLPNASGFHVYDNHLEGGSVFARNIDASEFLGNTIRYAGSDAAFDIGYANDLVVASATIESLGGREAIRIRNNEPVNGLLISGNRLSVGGAVAEQGAAILAEDFAGSGLSIFGNTLSGSGSGAGIRLFIIHDDEQVASLEVSGNLVRNFNEGLRAGIRDTAANSRFGQVNVSANTFEDDQGQPMAAALNLGPSDSTFTASRLSVTDNRFNAGVSQRAAIDHGSHVLAELESAGCGGPGGDLVGWVYAQGRQGNPSIAILVDSESATAVTGVASTARPDIDSQYGITGARGFSIPLPAQYRDGAAHHVRIGTVISGTTVPSRATREVRCTP